MAIHTINRPLTASISTVKQVAATETGIVRGSVQADKAQHTDKLQLSPESLRLQEMEASVSTELPVDMERVKALRASIANGEYQVDATKVAKKMLDLEGELFK